MSVLLSWETPAELYDLRDVPYRVELYRALPVASSVSGARGTLLETSTPFGVYEDTEHSDPSATYELNYRRLDGILSKRISGDDIRKWKRPAQTCRIDMCFTRPDSSPWIGRKLKIFDIPGHGYVHDTYANVDGKAMMILCWDWRMRLEVEGWNQALEFVVPRTGLCSIEQVIDHYGAWVTLDPRSQL